MTAKQYKPKPIEIRARVPSIGLPRFRFSEQHSIRQARRQEEKKEFTPADEWIEAHVVDPTSVNKVTWDFATARRLTLEPFQRDILRHVLTPDADGLFPYTTVVWSQIKKSGKTQIAGAVGAWYAAEVEAPNIVLTIANDQEQSAGRIFGAMKPTFKLLGTRVPESPHSKPEVTLSNGTNVRAIANNYAGEAGENYGLTLWSELWAFTSERGRRLYDELVPVPTRKNSMRWIETYAGFEDESDLLLSIFLKVFADTTEKTLAPGARVVEELEHIRTDDHPACFAVPEAGIFYFCDHEKRMPWQRGKKGERYYNAQRGELRRVAYTRLHENRWQVSAGEYIEPEWIRRAKRLTTVSTDSIFEPMHVAIDASRKHDTTSVVGVRKKRDGSKRFETVFVEVHDPLGENINLRTTVQETVESLWEKGLIIEPVWYDPYEMHQVAIDLREKGIPCEEFPQAGERTKADTFMWQTYRDDMIDTIDSSELEEHLLSAKAREDKNGNLRIVKSTKTKSATAKKKGEEGEDGKQVAKSRGGKIDAAVAQSMALFRASQEDEREQDEFSVLAQDISTTGWIPS